MPSQEQVTANLKSAANVAAARVGVQGVADSDLTYEQRIRYNKELAAIIAKYPERFNADVVKTAQAVNAKAYQPLESQSLAQSAQIFAGEVARQAGDLNATFNPFSEANRKGFKWLLIAGGVVAAAVYFGPALLRGSRKLRASFR